MVFTSERQPRSRRPNLTYERAEALRAEWAAIVVECSRRSGYTPAELVAMHGITRATVFRDEGLPTQRDLARREDLSDPLLSLVLRGKAYTRPPTVVAARRGAALRVDLVHAATAGEVGAAGGSSVSDFVHYRDDGCEIAPRCLECPLPACRYDLPPKVAGALLRAGHCQKLLHQGLTADEVAVAMGVSRRTVFRLKQQPLTTPTPPALQVLAAREAARAGVVPLPVEFNPPRCGAMGMASGSGGRGRHVRAAQRAYQTAAAQH